MLIWEARASASSKRPSLGFAAPSMEQRHCREAVMPALATLTRCDSIASCMAERSCSVILSSSSIAASPLSARTSAPASRVHRPSPNSSLTAAAVLCTRNPLAMKLWAPSTVRS